MCAVAYIMILLGRLLDEHEPVVVRIVPTAAL